MRDFTTFLTTVNILRSTHVAMPLQRCTNSLLQERYLYSRKIWMLARNRHCPAVRINGPHLHQANTRLTRISPDLEVAPIGRTPECKLPETKGRLHAHPATIHLRAVSCLAARMPDEPPLRRPPPSHPRPHSLQEAGCGFGLRLRLLAYSRQRMFGYHAV